MSKVSIDSNQVDKLIKHMQELEIPEEQESGTHSFKLNSDARVLANAYFAIVSICHQTSPIGERRLCGYINGNEKYGWDYLKEKFLIVLDNDEKWRDPLFWKNLTPNDLSSLYEDKIHGKTLNRINERSFLLNDLGRVLTNNRISYVFEAFVSCSQKIYCENGFLEFLKQFEAYKDPLMKKSLFFLSIVSNECNWELEDEKRLPSPIDYHELRGHLRIGTVKINDLELNQKVKSGQPISEEDDTELRSNAQKVNGKIAKRTGLSGSIVHYMLWNIFRNCCLRDSQKTHCTSCDNGCTLPRQYQALSRSDRKCIFSDICESANQDQKYMEPAYIGHYY